jgi:hypothetical protein
MAQSQRVQLTSCLGLWQGCIPPDQPALVWHFGHPVYDLMVVRLAGRYQAQLAWFQSKKLAATYGTHSNSNTSVLVPAAAAAG